MMNYRKDNDLEFLKNLKSKDLNDLVYYITKRNNGSNRLTENLTETKEYKHSYPEHHQYWKLIVAQIQHFGANNFATFFRGGKGVLYKEILTDVCDKLKVNYNKKANIEVIENNLLMKILTDTLDKMSSEDLKKIALEIGIKNVTDLYSKKMLVTSFQTVFRSGGFKSYQLTVIIVNAIVKTLLGKGLSFSTNALLTKTISIFIGPVGWVLSGLWFLNDIAGPAYRITIPSVVLIALLRKKHKRDKIKKMIFIISILCIMFSFYIIRIF